MTTPDPVVNLDVLIPRRIKALRTFFDFRAADLDRLAGLSVGTTRRLERGDQRVYTSHLFRICQSTGVGLNYFYDDQATPTSVETQEKIRLLQAYHDIECQATKRNVYELVEALALNPSKSHTS